MKSEALKFNMPAYIKTTARQEGGGMAELNEHFCMICGRPKNNPKSITCEHPQCINTVLECIEEENQFSSTAKNNDIKTPQDLKKYFNNVRNLKIDVESMLEMLNVKKLKESLKSALSTLDTKDLEKSINEIKMDTESLD
jgi:hypothetical protein